MLLSDLEVILHVAEHRSITAAATQLDMQTATASAAVKRVEKYLGAELFTRTTRQLTLSLAGERYLSQCKEAIALLNQAKQNVQDDLDIISGEIRIAMPSDLGRNVLAPWLDEFLDTHPQLTLKTHLSDSQIDFYRDNVDIAIRYSPSKDANLYGFKICDVPSVLCASPDYLSKFGAPNSPTELSQHNGLFYQLHDIIHDVWEFKQKGKTYQVKMKGNRASNDGDQVRRWCVDGKGVAVKATLDITEDLTEKRLIPIMTEFKSREIELWMVSPSRQSITPAIRLLRDHIKQRCEEKIRK